MFADSARTTIEVIGLCFSIFMAGFSAFVSWNARGLQIMSANFKVEIAKELAGLSVDIARFKADLTQESAQVKLDVATRASELKVHVAEEAGRIRLENSINRLEDREEMKRWINGSFMRAPEVTARLESLDRGLQSLGARRAPFVQKDERG